MGIYYDEIQNKYYDNDWDICAVCSKCEILVNEERSTVLCEKCHKNICTRCAENGLTTVDENDNIVCIECL